MPEHDEQWQWIVDLTTDEPKLPPRPQSKTDKEDERKVYALLHKRMWTCAEERIGRWIGFVTAVLFWGMMAISYYNYTMQPKPVMYYDADTQTMKPIPGLYKVGGKEMFLQVEDEKTK